MSKTILVTSGQVKVRNFTNSKNKAAYAYLLTPKGLEEKSIVTARFLKRKIQEYEQLNQEIQQLQKEAKKLGLKIR